MRTISGSDDLRAALAEMRQRCLRIGFVPTMGNLHAGHYSLIDQARAQADVVVASVFVNPTQFGPGEDFARYPRTPEADVAGLADHACDLLFLPGVEEIYPHGAAHAVQIREPDLTDQLEGACRPGHFDGVATVVAKLFNLVQPQIAVFGQKDYQQLLVIRRMVCDLRYAIEILAAPIVRDADGLAMSSRNQYLDAPQRGRAVAIHRTLEWMRERVLDSTDALATIEALASSRLTDAGLVCDYAVIRHVQDLCAPNPGAPREGLIGLVAARAGSTRLIDNLIFAP